MTNKPTLPRLSKATGPEGLAAEHVVAEFEGRFRWSQSLGWLAWDGMRWSHGEAAESLALDAVRLLVKARNAEHGAASTLAGIQALDVLAAILVRLQRYPDRTSALAHLDTLDRKDQDGYAAGEPEASKVDEHRRQQDREREQADIWLNMLQDGKLQAIARIARRTDAVRVTADELDQHPDLLNVRNGVIDLRTGELGPHDPELLITKLAAAEYRPGAAHPLWTKALTAVHPDLHEWLQERFGQSATGHPPNDDRMLVNDGLGENGKTTVINAVKLVLGDYAGLVPHKALLGEPGAHTTELMTFRGLRMAVLEETPEEGHLDMHRVKMTVGTPEITARLMRRDNVTFRATHTMWINTNHLPQVSTTDRGSWRRLARVPWPFTYVQEEPTESHHRPVDRTVRPALLIDPADDVRAAVLAWVIEGARRLYAGEGVLAALPPAVVESTQAWRVDSDVALLFTREMLVGDEGALITTQDMQDALNAFVEQRSQRRWGAPTVKTRLTDALAAAGIRGGHSYGRVKAGVVQSARPDSGDPFAMAAAARNGNGTVQPGATVRAWFGVRFRTTADDVHLRLAQG